MDATLTVLRTPQVISRLRERYKAPEFAFFTEVAEGTGAFAGRRADGLAMSLWPSRGLTLTGFEVKVSRADWLTELKHPEKAEPIAQYCDHWFIVAGSESIVRLDELPPNWGLLVPNKNGLRVVKESPRKETKPIGRPFLAAILRRSHEGDAHAQEIAEAVEKARTKSYEEGLKVGEERAGYRLPRLEEQLVELKTKIAEFEEVSGVDVCAKKWDSRNVGNVANALKLLLGGGVEKNLDQILFAKKTASEVMELITGYEEWRKQTATATPSGQPDE